jgi:hypothetical protein
VNPLAADLRRAVSPVALAGVVGLVPDGWQTDVLRSRHPRILMCVSRQAGKSTTCSVLAVHTAVYEPGSVVLLLSPSIRQSQELFRKCIAVYRALGRPVAAETETALTLTLENRSRIVSLPGTSDTIRAYSAVKLLIVDEASRVDDDIMAAVRPMMAVSGGRLIAVSTPAGKRGWWWDAWSSRADWMRVHITAEQCPRISAEFLAEERAAHGDFLFRQEYMGEFLAGSDQVFTEEQIQRAFDHNISSIAI